VISVHKLRDLCFLKGAVVLGIGALETVTSDLNKNFIFFKDAVRVNRPNQSG
jgi:hypothetical protein